LPNNDIIYDTKNIENDKYILFCGTKIGQKISLKKIRKQFGMFMKLALKLLKELISNILFIKRKKSNLLEIL